MVHEQSIQCLKPSEMPKQASITKLPLVTKQPEQWVTSLSVWVINTDHCVVDFEQLTAEDLHMLSLASDLKVVSSMSILRSKQNP